MWRAGLALAALAVLAASCDGVVFVSFNSGIVIGDPICRDRSGQFDFRNQEGLTLVVIISDSTNIFYASGGGASCNDLGPGAPVQVRGPQEGERILATDVRLE
jgi:hypothetical protein